MVLYKRFKKYNAGLLLNAEIRTSQLQFKKKEAMAQIKDAIDKVIEIESQNIFYPLYNLLEFSTFF